MPYHLTPEQESWKKVVHDFALNEIKPHAREMDESGQLNREMLEKMSPMGLLSMNIPEELGGSAVDPVSAAIAIEEIAWACGSTALSVAAHNGLGCDPIARFGSAEQKERFLTPFTTGAAHLSSLALTESGAGSDLKGGVKTRAEKRNGEWVINGEKMWCTNAGLANHIVTLVRTDPAGGSHSLSLIVVPTDTPGLSIAPPEKKMGTRASPAHAVSFNDVRVPESYLLGEEGRGLRYTLATLDGGRISIGALSLGLAQAAFETAAAYAQEREVMGQTISNLQAIQWMLADAAVDIHAARLMIYQAAYLKENGQSFTRQAAIAKLFATEMAERVCRDAIQIHGGYGVSAEYPVERMYRDARIMTIGEGTSEIQRLVIARCVLDH